MTEMIHSPTSRSIAFDEATEFEAKGRNGFMKTAGVTLIQMPNGEIHLGCITSKGVHSDAIRLPVPKKRSCFLGECPPGHGLGRSIISK